MTETKISEAGKGSTDPAQQHLRQQKAIWNAAAKALIAKLIYFKRGMNGRGEPKAGLPKSKIEFPMPAEIGSYLDGIATDFAAIVEGAEAIIQEQEHYSQVRRKPQQHVQNMTSSPANTNAVQPVPVAAADDGLLVAEASWFGSRLWAKSVGLRGEGKADLVDMIDHANEIRKTLEDLENILTSSNANAIATAVTTANTLGLSSIKLFQKSFARYNELHDKMTKKQDEDRAKNEADNTKKELVDAKNSRPEKIEVPVATPPIATPPVQQPAPAHNPTQDPEVRYYELCRQFNLAKDDLKKGNKVIEFAKTRSEQMHIADPKDKYYSNLLNYSTDLGQIAKVMMEIKKTNGSGDIARFQKSIDLLEWFLKAYWTTIQICSKVLEIEIPRDRWDSYEGFKTLLAGLAQTKQAGVKSYLKKRWMKFVNTIVSDKIETMKLQSLDKIVVALDHFNVLLNTLETPGSIQPKIEADVVKAFKQLHDVYLTLLTLADLHNNQRDNEKLNGKKNVVMFEIKERNVRNLRKIMELMMSMIEKPAVKK